MHYCSLTPPSTYLLILLAIFSTASNAPGNHMRKCNNPASSLLLRMPRRCHGIQPEISIKNRSNTILPHTPRTLPSQKPHMPPRDRKTRLRTYVRLRGSAKYTNTSSSIMHRNRNGIRISPCTAVCRQNRDLWTF